jgi:hypothetical protein
MHGPVVHVGTSTIDDLYLPFGTQPPIDQYASRTFINTNFDGTSGIHETLKLVADITAQPPPTDLQSLGALGLQIG